MVRRCNEFLLRRTLNLLNVMAGWFDRTQVRKPIRRADGLPFMAVGPGQAPLIGRPLGGAGRGPGAASTVTLGGFSGMSQGAPIDAHTYGDTFAEEAVGHSGSLAPSYAGSHGFEGLDAGFYARNPHVPRAGNVPVPGAAARAASAVSGTWQPGDDYREAPVQRGTMLPPVGAPVVSRADGGPVTKGKPVLVGEEGPEVIVPHGSAGKGTGLKPPVTGLAKFHELNPTLPTAAQAEAVKLILNPAIPMPIRGPQPALGTVPLPSRAEGGPVTRGQPVLVGEEGPEVIVPQQNGVVIPNHAIMPEWTPESLRAVAAQQYRAGNIDPTTFGLASNLLSGDPSARVVEGARAGLSMAWNEDQRAEAEARERAMNPQGIIVGVTPREALTAPAGAPLPGGLPASPSREDREFARINRNIMRAARDKRNLPLALRLFQGREAAAAAAQQASQDRAWEAFKFLEQEERLAATANETVRHHQATERRLTDKAAADEAQEQAETISRLFSNAQVATNLQMQGRLPGNQAVNIMTMTDPGAQDLLLKQAAFNMPVAPNQGNVLSIPSSAPAAAPQAWQGVPFRVPGDVTAGPSQSSVAPAAPPAGDPRDWESVPTAIDATTGKATSHQWLPKRVDRDKQLDRLTDLYERRDSLTKPPAAGTRKILEAEIERIEQELGIGKAAAGGGGATSGKKQPTSGFLKAVNS